MSVSMARHGFWPGNIAEGFENEQMYHSLRIDRIYLQALKTDKITHGHAQIRTHLAKASD